MESNSPFGWHYAFGAIGTGVLFVAPFLCAWYATSDFHRRGVSRRRAHRRQKGTAR